jgi:hypothetical protein
MALVEWQGEVITIIIIEAAVPLEDEDSPLAQDVVRLIQDAQMVMEMVQLIGLAPIIATIDSGQDKIMEQIMESRTTVVCVVNGTTELSRGVNSWLMMQVES